MRQGLIGAVLLSIAAVVGCGGADAGKEDTAASAAPAAAAAAGVEQAGVASPAAELLTVSEVERISGVSGVQVVPKDPSKGAGGDVNYADANGELLAMMLVQGTRYHEQSLEYMKGGQVAGIGDRADIGPTATDPYIIMFRKGDRLVSISSFLRKEDAKPRLSLDQLKELAKTVEAKL
ncbi:MAG TPA: hypothetical protein VEA99_11535 [Gemmatimonadaceae bacterium]|nr:hypothetical protein [Gemmatimonadaceae bacterium]